MRGGTVQPTQRLHGAGQSIWLDNITRALLSSGTLERYIDELSVTGLTSNPAIYDKAIEGTSDYDRDVLELAPGDVIALGHRLSDPLQVRVCDTVKFDAYPMQDQGHAGVRLLQAVANPTVPEVMHG